MKIPFFSSGSWDIEGVRPPWGERPAIYEHILKRIRAGLGEEGELLPDEEIARAGSEMHWVPGAFDGVFGHHGGNSDAEETANKILESFRALTKEATDQRAGSMYQLLLEHRTLSYADQLLELVTADDDLEAERIHTIAHWLATRAADREPIKCAIALLGVCHGGDDRDLLLTLGRHEEFTLFASVALKKSSDDPELSLWALACLVTGWGRIHIVERLAETKNEQIKAWMLREGYENDIMPEYTALICATTGELLAALRKPDPDDKLLKGAAAILTALIRGRGGPAEGIDAYEDGADATELYLSHLQTRVIELQDLVDVSRIDQFLKENSNESDPIPGWQQRNATLIGLTNKILSRPGWEQKVRDGLNGEYSLTFWTATEAARLLAIDVWDIYFERLKRGEDLWFYCTQTNEDDRFERVIRFAEETLPLNEIASGPADSLALGPEFQYHNALDLVLQELRRFPGKGWTLIRTGLKSTTVRNRNMAVQALAAWDLTAWPDEAVPLLRNAIEAEPNEQTRELMLKALEGAST